MGTKTISIMDDVYNLLIQAKQKDESFSEVIRRTLTKQKDPLDYFGILSDLTDEQAQLMEDAIKQARKSERKYLR